MGKIETRTCACCKNNIEVDTHNIQGVVYYGKSYYHVECFKEMATQKAAGRRGKPEMWREALEHLGELEASTQRMLESYFAKDELNVWLLEHYDIIEVPKRFFQIVADLEVGKYKGKRCNPVKTSTFCECWKWGQKKLDEIALRNKANHQGPIDDNARIMYDLAVLVGKVPIYLNIKAEETKRSNEISREAESYFKNLYEC